jgi:hypothetical protein
MLRRPTMTDKEFDEIEADEPDLEADLDDEIEVDDVVDGDLDPDLKSDTAVVVVEPDAPRDEAEDATKSPAADDEDALDLDEEHHPDDVEEPLDVLLKERVAAATLEDEEEEVEDLELDERGAEGTTKIVPRRPGEFLCSSCFLVLPRSQLADEERMLCRDCA